MAFELVQFLSQYLRETFYIPIKFKIDEKYFQNYIFIEILNVANERKCFW